MKLNNWFSTLSWSLLTFNIVHLTILFSNYKWVFLPLFLSLTLMAYTLVLRVEERYYNVPTSVNYRFIGFALSIWVYQFIISELVALKSELNSLSYLGIIVLSWVLCWVFYLISKRIIRGV
jgi:hypothetical protein